MDFAQIAKLLEGSGGTLVNIFKFYDKNKDFIDMIIKLIMQLGDRPPAQPPEEIPSDPPKENPNPPAVTGQVYYGLHARCFFLEDDRNGSSGGRVLDRNTFNRVLSESGPDAQMAGQRMHIDITPLDRDGQEIGPDDPRHPRVPGDVALRYLWTYDGKINTDSRDEKDRFHLESVKDDFGCTPVLLLEETSSGRKKVTFKARILPEFNGGVSVVSNEISWYAD